MDIRWMRSFDAFFNDVGPCPDRHQATRPDPEQPYGPGNFAWVPSTSRKSPGRPARYYSFGGESRTLREWAACSGVTPGTLRARLARQVPFQQAISTADLRKKA